MYKRTIPIIINAGLLFLEAAITSAYVRFSLSFMGYQSFRKWQGEPIVEMIDESKVLSSSERITVLKISNAIQRCNKFCPWKTECYTLALTAKILLKRREMKIFLYIGFKKNSSKTEGHAWLRVGRIIVTGKNVNLNQFSINGIYF